MTLRPWQPEVAGIREVLHAHFPPDSHAYPMHAHDTWTLLVVDRGAVRYHLDRHVHVTQPAAVTLLPPHVPHDGRAATAEGFRKRVVYLDPGVVSVHVADSALARPAHGGATLRGQVEVLHRLLADGREPLAAETQLVGVLEVLHAAWGTGGPGAVARGRPDRDAAIRADRLRDLLDQHLEDGVSLQSAADLLGTSRSALVHAFRRRFQMTPHRYLVSRRLDVARDLLLRGVPAAEAAVRSGFHDQAHLSRHFKRLLGVPPGVWAAGARA